MSALALYHKDAVVRVKGFMADFRKPAGPPSPLGTGNYHYKEELLEGVEEFMGIRIRIWPSPSATRLRFKLGHCSSSVKNSRKPACTCTTSWTWRANSSPAQYYFSHIAYLNGQPQVAFDRFERIADHPALRSWCRCTSHSFCTPPANSTAEGVRPTAA